ncbi:hypothetical protein [uncultured Nostoc sp.]|uniref:hypothetical protein n=1 Tax=uncultured Nostoc sp. TaxID=340711 RepID=UPI0035CC0C84
MLETLYCWEIPASFSPSRQLELIPCLSGETRISGGHMVEEVILITSVLYLLPYLADIRPNSSTGRRK